MRSTAVSDCRAGHTTIPLALSVVMGASMHAVQATHLNHHRRLLGERDIEGRVALLPFPAILFAGPRFIIDLHRFALRRGTRQRPWVFAELAAVALSWSLVAVWVGNRSVLLHEIAMLSGEVMTAFFAVWIVHRASGLVPTRARTERRSWINLLTYNVLLHAEHHAYRAVPTTHWPELARRRAAAGERVELDVVSNPLSS